MRIYIGESDRWKDKPLYRALVEAMRANDIAGVTVYRGILGYGAHRHMHKDKALHLSHHCSKRLWPNAWNWEWPGPPCIEASKVTAQAQEFIVPAIGNSPKTRQSC